MKVSWPWVSIWERHEAFDRAVELERERELAHDLIATIPTLYYTHYLNELITARSSEAAAHPYEFAVFIAEASTSVENRRALLEERRKQRDLLLRFEAFCQDRRDELSRGQK